MTLRTASVVPAPAPHELRRERLLELLHRHGARPLLLLVAPAGFGKSTLAATYARDSGAVVAWLTLQPDDRDSRVFFSHLRDVMEFAFDEAGLLHQLRRGLLEGAEGVGLARLVVEDLAQAPQGFILVLDDFHSLGEAADVEQSVDALVRGLPEMGQVVITSREPPALSMVEMVASDAVFALGSEDLRFSDEETQALRQTIGGDASHDAEAEGWVAGILLGGAPRHLGVSGGTLLGGYVEREVLARLGRAEQRWLETLAVLDTITPAAAGRLLGAAYWPARLASLGEQCPFLAAGEDGSYRLHGLVREALLNRLRRGNPRRAARAWGEARTLAEEQLDSVGVVRACRELGEIEEAVVLVQRTTDEAMRLGRWSAALATIELLPETVRRAHPLLSLAEAHALVQSGKPARAREAAEAALEHGGRSGDVQTQVQALLELATVASYTGNPAETLDWISAADHLLTRGNLPRERHRLLAGRALGLKGVAQAIAGRSTEARRALEAAAALLQAGGPSRELAVVGGNLGVLCARIGDYPTARRVLTDATSQWRLLGDRTALAGAQTMLGNLHLRCGDLDAAGSVLSSALDAARAVGAMRQEGHVMNSLAEWHRASGRLGDAATAFDASSELAVQAGDREQLIEALRLRAEVAVVQNDQTTARALLGQAQSEGQRLGSDFQMAGVERALGRLHLAEGASQRAATHLEAALERSSGVWGPFERVATFYWVGTAYLALGRANDAEQALRSAVALAVSIDAAAVLVGPAAENPRLLNFGLDGGIEPLVLRDVRDLAARREPWAGLQPPSSISLVSESELPRIEVRLFGSLVVHRDGVLIETGRKRLDRARELFAILVLHPGGLPARELETRLWPAMEPERAHHNLEMAAFSLRRFLGSKAALRYLTGSYQLAPQLPLWADTREFDLALERARVATAEEVVTELRRAVELYRGMLMVDAGWSWVGELRARYHGRFVDSALRLTSLLAPREPLVADSYAEQVVAVDPLNEAAYEALLQSAFARRDAAGVSRIRQRYQLAVDVAGVPPSPRLLKAL